MISRRILLARAGFVFLLGIVTVISVWPNPAGGVPGNAITRFIAALFFDGGAHADKVGHFLAYSALGGVAFLAAIARKPIWRAPLLLALYGVGLEGVQYFIDARSADLWDAAVNTFGAATGVVAAFALTSVYSKLQNRLPAQRGNVAAPAGDRPILRKGDNGVGGWSERGADNDGDRQH